jgi:5'-nucleotidase
VNDDGIGSEGLVCLADRLKEEHELWIVAPDSQKSGSSHAITLSGAVISKQIDERSFTITGTPADCVLVGLQSLVPGLPDLVISGINIGPNLGADLIYSGTAAAARQAAILGIPGVAVSLNTLHAPMYFSTAVYFIAENIMNFINLWKRLDDPTHFLNVNIPNTENYSGNVVVAPPAKLTYENHLSSFDAPYGEIYHFYNDVGRRGLDENIVTDIDELKAGNIVLSPVRVYPENSKITPEYVSYGFINSLRS